jgi:cytoskeletal protein RodZ
LRIEKLIFIRMNTKKSKRWTMPKALLVIPVAALAIGVFANNTAVGYSTTQNDIDAITTATETYSQPVAKQKAKKPKKQKKSKQKRQKDAKPKKLKDHKTYTVERDSANAK